MHHNCIIIHGTPDENEHHPERSHWIPWAKQELIAHGVTTYTPRIPGRPDYHRFKQTLEQYDVNENTILIGHSSGCALLVRWLGETKPRIHHLILVAPWNSADEPDEHDLYNYAIDPTITTRATHITIFTSDDEDEPGRKSAISMRNALDAQLITLDKHGHYTLEDMGTASFPQLIEIVRAHT